MLAFRKQHETIKSTHIGKQNLDLAPGLQETGDLHGRNEVTTVGSASCRSSPVDGKRTFILFEDGLDDLGVHDLLEVVSDCALNVSMLPRKQGVNGILIDDVSQIWSRTQLILLLGSLRVSAGSRHDEDTADGLCGDVVRRGTAMV